MKTIFDVTRDGVSCSLPVFSLFGSLRHLTFPFQEFCSGKNFILFGPDKNLLGQNLDLVIVWKNIFGVVNDNKKYSFYLSNGTLIDENVTSYNLFDEGLLALYKERKGALYRLDGSLIHQGMMDYHVSPDGKTFLAHDDEDVWAFFNIDGSKIAENVTQALMKTADFYALRLADGPLVVYDKGANTQFVVPENADLQLLELGMFMVQKDDYATLYRSDGVKLLDGAHGYFCFQNGLVWENPYDKHNCLYDKNLNPILKKYGLYLGDDCGRLFHADKDYIIDQQGKIVATYPACSTMACGSGYYLAWNETRDVVVLHRPDDTVVAENVVGAIGYPNNWKALFYSNGQELRRHEPAPFCSLLDDKDNVIVEKVTALSYLYDKGVYVYAKDGKFFLVDLQGKVIVDAADYICVIGDVYMVQRKDQIAEVYFFE